MSSARDTSAMDTLPLNGNFNNSYSLRNGDYGDGGGGVRVLDLGLDDAAFEKMIISELVHNNLRACGRSQRSEPRIATKKAGTLAASKPPPMHDVAPSLVRVASESEHLVGALGLHHPHHPHELEAPLIPQRTHSLLYHTQERGRTESGAEPRVPTPRGFVIQLPSRDEDDLSSPNRDSIYASLPNLRDSPSPSPTVEGGPIAVDNDDELSPSKQSENEDVYYKSMPNLGAGQQLQAYYQISRGSSDSYIIPVAATTATAVAAEGCVPEGDVREGQMQLVTSL